jgi:hypothetical protein
MIHPKNKQTRKETPGKLDISNGSFSFDRTREQSISEYFKRKEEAIKQSPFKTVLRNTFQKPLNKTSFLIYEYTKHRQFCNKKNITQVYISTCPFRNCHFTCNFSLVHRADAILMLYSHLNYANVSNLTAGRSANQIWLLWHDEPYPPSSIYNKLLFNWTISYRFDSEVSVATYGITFMRNESMNPSAFNNWINENYKKRRNEAVW